MTKIEKFKTLVDVPNIEDWVEAAESAIAEVRDLIEASDDKDLSQPLMDLFLKHSLISKKELSKS